MAKNLLVTIDTPKKICGNARKQFEQYYQKDTPKLVNANGEEIPISDNVFKVLQEILPALEQGKTIVTISPANSEVTTQEAADILNVSRPYLIKLLNNNEIPHVKTGSHRRIKLKDVMDYKEKREAQTAQSFNQLTEIMQDNGLFD
ncbi:helix-turn-helix domain-containing protein [Scytonema sp. UIC 10036]|uniref:helix-turn-helix domain-containing protein n=1 Tax=Scytonema sp. UIC 10036 TaxID=2304196 RepID=UPI0012DA40E9|nr:helix-turn-helix domain-containing protein [Scytonema sp. UIC 10036]MUG94944.1 helix-turn-helix domain-containing protein [Scytonema sp. UIC 10036]